MRIENWKPDAFDGMFEKEAVERLVKAAEYLADVVRRKCPVGTVSRPIYVRGPYKGKPWTARDAGQLKRSTRVTQKRSKYGKVLWRKRNVRVYSGDYLAYYASIVEALSTSYMRASLTEAHEGMTRIIQGG